MLLCGTLAVMAGDKLRIAVVDLDRVFREYYKSRIAEEFLTRQAEAARLYMTQLNTRLEAQRAEARRLETNALNPALKDSDRRSAAEAAEAARARVRTTENEIALYTGERTRELHRLETERRQEIIADIQREVRRRAAAENYTFVLDRSGKSANDLPVVLIYPQTNDISDAVIRELNRAAVQQPTPSTSER